MFSSTTRREHGFRLLTLLLGVAACSNPDVDEPERRRESSLLTQTELNQLATSRTVSATPGPTNKASTTKPSSVGGWDVVILYNLLNQYCSSCHGWVQSRTETFARLEGQRSRGAFPFKYSLQESIEDGHMPPAWDTTSKGYFAHTADGKKILEILNAVDAAGGESSLTSPNVNLPALIATAGPPPVPSPTTPPQVSPIASPTTSPIVIASPTASPTANPIATATANPVATATANPVATATANPVATATPAPAPLWEPSALSSLMVKHCGNCHSFIYVKSDVIARLNRSKPFSYKYSLQDSITTGKMPIGWPISGSGAFFNSPDGQTMLNLLNQL